MADWLLDPEGENKSLEKMVELYLPGHVPHNIRSSQELCTQEVHHICTHLILFTK
jgi:hypothetical protein